MASSFKVLYQGQLPSSITTLATVPTGTQWIVKDISMVNTDSSDRTAALYHNGVTGTALITPPAVSIVAGGMYAFSGGSITFETGGTLAGVASSANKITVTVSGDEVT